MPAGLAHYPHARWACFAALADRCGSVTSLLAALVPSPSPSVSMSLASLHWFSSVTGAVVLGGHRVAMDTASVGHYCIWRPFHHHPPTPRLNLLYLPVCCESQPLVTPILYPGTLAPLFLFCAFGWYTCRIPTAWNSAGFRSNTTEHADLWKILGCMPDVSCPKTWKYTAYHMAIDD